MGVACGVSPAKSRFAQRHCSLLLQQSSIPPKRFVRAMGERELVIKFGLDRAPRQQCVHACKWCSGSGYT